MLATCRRLGIPTRDYQLDVLPRLGRTMTHDVARMTPQAWLQAGHSAVASPGSDFSPTRTHRTDTLHLVF